ncbi:DUF1853 family protein [Teredinibacter sp. KSP-S5-2]|uniref:DUF1853 family protein n=1 Tax=Teredinibacter sp. KSP-S5-2 TaxID=3034506 RepID=UPI0029347D3B|nr:DUF1853 family protein [Teredinibacter sp. KSP-S5-2]WNO11071.1 DUF1853 family protein [Teredinibacter sp. KSP-S5-2]
MPIIPWPHFPFSILTVVDLAFILSSNNIIYDLGGIPSLEYPFNQDQKRWLSELDTHKNAQFPERKHFSRVGLYFEALIEFLTTRGFEDGIFPYKLIKKNLQVQHNKVTLGEFDFILADKNNTPIHLETAIKFYLLNDRVSPNETAHWLNWIGPNSKDRLDLKLHRMQNHQLRLSSHQATKDALHTYGVDSANLQIRHLIKGCFFIHLNQATQREDLFPEKCEKSCVSGYWLRRSELQQKLKTNVLSICFLQRTAWITGDKAAIFSNNAENELIPNQCMARLTRQPHVIFRLMIVPDHWPSAN